MPGLTLILTVALPLGFAPSHSPGDHAFRAALSEFVVQSTPPERRSLDRFLAPRHAALIRALGCPRYECRELAAGSLRSLDDAAFFALLLGRRHRDAEVAGACRVLLDESFACRHCRGSGVCPAHVALDPQDWEYCRMCPRYREDGTTTGGACVGCGGGGWRD